MPTYIYETIPDDPKSEPRRFEVTQRMTDEPMRADPLTGERVKRIVTGGLGIKRKVLRRSTVINKSSAAATACACATGRPHRHKAKSQGHGCGHKY